MGIRRFWSAPLLFYLGLVRLFRLPFHFLIWRSILRRSLANGCRTRSGVFAAFRAQTLELETGLKHFKVKSGKRSANVEVLRQSCGNRTDSSNVQPRFSRKSNSKTQDTNFYGFN